MRCLGLYIFFLAQLVPWEWKGGRRCQTATSLWLFHLCWSQMPVSLLVHERLQGGADIAIAVIFVHLNYTRHGMEKMPTNGVMLLINPYSCLRKILSSSPLAPSFAKEGFLSPASAVGREKLQACLCSLCVHFSQRTWGPPPGPRTLLSPRFLSAHFPLLCLKSLSRQQQLPMLRKACWAISWVPLSLLVLEKADKEQLEVPPQAPACCQRGAPSPHQPGGKRRVLACRSGFREPLPGHGGCLQLQAGLLSPQRLFWRNTIPERRALFLLPAFPPSRWIRAQ